MGDWIAAVMLSIGVSFGVVGAVAEDEAADGEDSEDVEPPPEHAASTNASAATVPTRAGRRPTLRTVEIVMLSPREMGRQNLYVGKLR